VFSRKFVYEILHKPPYRGWEIGLTPPEYQGAITTARNELPVRGTIALTVSHWFGNISYEE
jgi:hypothetical protein